MSPLLRNRILVCACDLFLEAGLDGFSMRKLAKRVGVTAPALYRHFDSREEILLEVVNEAFKVMAQYLYGALKAPSPDLRLRMAGEGYLEFALENPRYYEIVHASAQALGVERFPAETLAEACAVGQFWNDRVRECMDAGVLREDDPERVSATLWAHAHGLISLHLRGNLEMKEAGFRLFYLESIRRTFAGIASDGYRAAILAEPKALPPRHPGTDGPTSGAVNGVNNARRDGTDAEAAATQERAQR